MESEKKSNKQQHTDINSCFLFYVVVYNHQARTIIHIQFSANDENYDEMCKTKFKRKHRNENKSKNRVVQRAPYRNTK